MSVERFKRYADKLVAVQLRRPLFMLSFGGTAMIDGKEQYGVVPAVFPERTVRDEHGEEQTLPPANVGFAEVIPAAMFEVTESGAVLLRMIDPATKARLAIDIDPADILYITSVEQPPPQIIKP